MDGSQRVSRFRNPSNGYEENVGEACLWCLLAGPIYFAAKGIWLHAATSLLLAIGTSGISWFIYPFFANWIVRKHYLRNGWAEVEATPDLPKASATGVALVGAIVGLFGFGLAISGIAYAYNYITHDRHAANVEIVISPHEVKGAVCSDTPEYPLFVSMINRSSKTVETVTFSFEARRKGYSANLATYASYSDDKILKPNEGYGTCWRAPLQAGVNDEPRDLEWKIGRVRIQFQ